MSLWETFSSLLMGCGCSKEAIYVENRKFYLKNRLGEGGFSYIDIIEEARTQSLFALKTIKCYSRRDKRIALKEVNYMKELLHPNLITCEAFEEQINSSNHNIISEFYIVLPFYQRGSIADELEQLAQRRAQLDESRICHLMRGLCAGLRALHHHQPPLAHRDIKPHNVLLGNDDAPVLMDFGSMAEARVHVQSHAQAQTLQDEAAERCSMPYRAPELFNVEVGMEVTEATDIWSLGCFLYALCYLESPFDPAFQRGDSVALATINGLKGLPDDGEFSRYSQSLRNLIFATVQVEPEKRLNILTIADRLREIEDSHVNRI